MESSRKMKFTHKVDYDMIKIKSEGKLIYFIIVIKKDTREGFSLFLIAIINEFAFLHL